MGNKLKHLEFIQANISRIASYSFLLKGWSVTLVAALLALASKNTNFSYIIVAYFPVLIFWLLDGYFLKQERLFRSLYDEVRTQNDDQINFSMDVKKFHGGRSTWVWSIFSATLLTFYLSMVIIMLIIVCLLK